MSMTCSIAMCTYNGEKYLQEQLDSFVAQSRLPDELVVCDDCSSDKTLEILEAFAKTAPFEVRIIRNEKNLGYNKNFAQTALKCTKDIVFFSDQDDHWYPDKISLYMDVFEKQSDVGLVISDSNENGQSHAAHLIQMRLAVPNFDKLIERDDLRLLVCRNQTYPGHSIAYKRAYNAILFPLPLRCIDLDIHYDIWAFTLVYTLSKCSYINKITVDYRVHSQSAVAQTNVIHAREMSQYEQQLDGMKLVYHLMAETAFFYHSFIEGKAKEYSSNRAKTQKLSRLFYLRGVHYERRSKMRSSVICRFFYAFIELLNGNYFRFSSGILSFGKDLLSK